MADIRPISDALAKKAKDELNEDPKRISEEIETLRNWILKQPHLRARIDDQFLLTFLRGCKHSIERAKQKIDMYYTIRTAIPELFLNRSVDDAKTRAIIHLGVQIFLPLTNGDDGPRIFLIRPGLVDPEKFHIKEVIRVSTLISDIQLIEDDSIAIAGMAGILDLANVTKSLLLQFDPMFIKKMVTLNQDASPLRQKGFHYIHNPKGFEIIYNLFKGFMSEKNRNRLHIHGDNMESLYQYIPLKILPKEYGGKGESTAEYAAMWEAKVLSYREHFIEEQQYGVDEKLRPGKPKNQEDLFGVDGTFRKLEFD